MCRCARVLVPRSKTIPDVRPPLFVNDSNVTIFFAGNGLFPLFVDITSVRGSGFDMSAASPPDVTMFSYPDTTSVKRPKLVDPHDWDMPSFKRVDRHTYVLKLGFKKAIGASRFFFLRVSITSGDRTVTLTSNLFKVATKPRKLVIGNLDESWTVSDLANLCPELGKGARGSSVSRAARAAAQEKGVVEVAGPTSDNRAQEEAGDGIPRQCFSVMFATPSKCLAFFADNYLRFHNLGLSFHLVPKRPLKMQPPKGLVHNAVTELTCTGGLSPMHAVPATAAPPARVAQRASRTSSASPATMNARCVPRLSLPSGSRPRPARKAGRTGLLSSPTALVRVPVAGASSAIPVLVHRAPSLPTPSALALGVTRAMSPSVMARSQSPVLPVVAEPSTSASSVDDMGDGSSGLSAATATVTPVSILSNLDIFPALPVTLAGDMVAPLTMLERGVSSSSVGTVDFMEMANNFFDDADMCDVGDLSAPVGWQVRVESGCSDGFGLDSPMVSAPMVSAPMDSAPVVSARAPASKRRMDSSPTVRAPPASRRRYVM